MFTTDRPVVFAYHGYPWLIHRLTYRRTNHDNIHVRGYKEEGTTTTPFDMVMLNDLDRFHLVMDVIDRVPGLGSQGRAPPPGDGRPAPRAAPTPGWHGEDARGQRLDLAVRVSRGAVLVVNAGSSSLKLARARRRTTRSWSAEDLPAPRGRADADALAAEAFEPSAPWTRSGTGSSTAARGSWSRCASTPAVEAELRALTDLAPLHQPKSLRRPRRWCRPALPGRPGRRLLRHRVPRRLPPAASTYALPPEWRQRWDAAPVRLPRPVARLRRAPGRRAAGSSRSRRRWSPATWGRRVAGGRAWTAGRWTPRWASRRWRAW